MKCQNCGTEFFEGLFCPECGTKWTGENESTSNEEAELKAQDLLKQYEAVDEEKKQIEEIGWDNSKDCRERGEKRLEQLKKLEQLNAKSAYAKEKIAKMRRELRDDYFEIEKEGFSLKSAIIMGIIAVLIGIFCICSFGVIGIIIGIWLILGAINIFVSPVMNKKTMEEIDNFLKNSNK